MNHLSIIWIFCFLAFSQICCHELSQSGTKLEEDWDSLAATIPDSPQSTDPWIIYTYTERQGNRIFEQYCVVCHGRNGEGDGFNAYNLNPRPHSLADSIYMSALSNETLMEIISFGGKGVNKSVLMPAYQNTLSKTQISNVVAYIGTFTRIRENH